MSLAQVIQQLLKPEETALLLESSNPPLMVLAAIGQLLAVSDMRIESKTHMDESVRQLQVRCLEQWEQEGAEQHSSSRQVVRHNCTVPGKA